MGSRGAYAGQPYSFMCKGCKTKRIEVIHTTGRTRAQRSEGMNYHNWGDVAFEYECSRCHHKGWSRHPDIARKHRLEHGDV